MANSRQVNFLIGANPEGFLRGMAQVQKKMSKVAKSTERIGRDLTRNVTTPLVALSGIALKSFSDFDSAMTKSTAIMGNVSTEMRKSMEDAAMSISKDLAISATQAAESFFFLASAGLSAEQSIAALPQVAKFAQAGAFSMALATDLATDAQSALGLTSKDSAKNLAGLTRVTDVLTKANTLANASIQQFSEALTNRAGAALRLVGKSVEEGAAVLAVFADQGVKGAEAGTRLDIVLRDLQNASLRNADLFDKMSIAVFDSNGNMRNMADIIGDMENAFAGMSNAQLRTALSTMGFTDRSVAATASLLGFSGAIRNYEVGLRNAAGTTDEVANNQMASFESQMILMRNAVQNLGTQFGRLVAQAITPLIGHITRLANRLEQLDENTMQNVLSIGLLVAGIGPAIMVIGKLIALISLLSIKFILIAAAVALVSAWVVTLVANANILAKEFGSAFDMMLVNITQRVASIIEVMSKLAYATGQQGLGASLVALSAQIRAFSNGIDLSTPHGEFKTFTEVATEALDSLHSRFKSFLFDGGVSTSINKTTDAIQQMGVAADQAYSPIAELQELLFGFKLDLAGEFVPEGSLLEAQNRLNTLRFSLQYATDPERVAQLRYEIDNLQTSIAGWGKATDKASLSMDFLTAVSMDFTSSFGAGMDNVIMKGDKLRDTLQNIGRLLASSAIQMGIRMLLTGGTGGGITGGILGGLFGISSSPVLDNMSSIGASSVRSGMSTQRIVVSGEVYTTGDKLRVLISDADQRNRRLS